MANPAMDAESKAVEVEKVLVAKLDASIKKVTTPWGSSLSNCKLLLEEKLKEEPNPDRKFRARFRRKVHHLNDLVAEYDSVTANANPRYAYRLCQIRKEIGSLSRQPLNGLETVAPSTKTAAPLIQRQTERGPSRPSPIDSYGLEVDQMAVQNLLLCRDPSPEFNAVGIYGAEGVGKTTLALVIFHCEKVKSRYLPRIWICLTDRHDSERKDSHEIFVAKRILLHLGIDPDRIRIETLLHLGIDPDRIRIETLLHLGIDPNPNWNLTGEELRAIREGLKRAIHRELKWKKYLVVLDGVSEEMLPVMAMLRDALPRGTGGAVMVTGRAEAIVKAMVGDENGAYQLHPLDKQEKCWNVFKAAMANQEDGGIGDKDERQKVKNEVVKRSHGLPWSSTLLGVIRREIVARPQPPPHNKPAPEIQPEKEVERSHGRPWWPFRTNPKPSQQQLPQPQPQQV